jgi:transcriptional regulator of met regulon
MDEYSSDYVQWRDPASKAMTVNDSLKVEKFLTDEKLSDSQERLLHSLNKQI